MTRIAFIYPEVPEVGRFGTLRPEYPPFGPLLLATVAESEGAHVEVFPVSSDDYIRDFSGFDIVAFSISASCAYPILKACRFESQINRNTLTVAGGVHCQILPEKTLIDLELDLLGYSAGETTIKRLLDFSKGLCRISEIPKIVYFDGTSFRKTPGYSLSQSLNTFAPARHLLSQSKFVFTGRSPRPEKKMTHALFNRGCPFSCAFCAVAETRMQYRSGQSCQEEIKHLRDAYNIESFAVVDDNFIVNKQRVIDICRSISNLGLTWSALSRTDMISKLIIDELALAGCKEIKFGIESADETLLRRMRKKTSIASAERALRISKSAGLETVALVMHGFPGENLRTTEKTIHFLKKNRSLIDRVSLTRFVPLPGTEVYNNPSQFDVFGVTRETGWDGDWSIFNIHQNNRHWWGNLSDFATLNRAYHRLKTLICTEWE